jgi:CRISPR-associated exonuclease Cas4
MLFIAFALALIGIWLLLRASQGRSRVGLPPGKVIYTDTGGWSPVPEPLYDPGLSLTGKPDYLVRKGGNIIPVEVKSGRAREEPYPEHVYQLAAYCALVQRVYGTRPTHGIIHYPNRTFAVDYTPALEASLRDLLDEMHRQERLSEVGRSHESHARCRRCGYRTICDQKL